MLTRRSLLAAAGAGWAPPPAPALHGDTCGTVFLHAWAGDGAVNAFIAWLNERMIMQYDIRVRHVRLADPASALRLAQGGEADGPLDAVLADQWQAQRTAPGSLAVCWRRLPRCRLLVIPAEAPHRTGALLMARFLLSPETQRRAADPLLTSGLPVT